MGFDLTLELRLRMNPDTGIPDLGWDIDVSGRATRIAYVAENYICPEKYRKWTNLRGRYLHMYVAPFDTEEVYEAEGCTFYRMMPTWDSIKEQAEEYDWEEDDHYKFVEAMEWFSKPGFYVSWSY
jgi:hypothetical protein